jgi:beta-mannosidase
MYSLFLSLFCLVSWCDSSFSVLADDQQFKRGPPLPSTHLSLSSFKWSLSNANRSITVPTPFLNQPHLALIKAGVIDDPNIGLNEGTVRWVGEEEAWTWETKFKVDTDGAWGEVERVS